MSMNPVVHFEISAKDMERAKEFYANVFGWEIQDMPEMNYTIVRTGPVDENYMPEKAGYIGGGMMPLDQSGVSTVIVIDVPDINSHLEKIKEAGGEIEMEPTNVGDMGMYARVKDTEDNIIGIWQDLKKDAS